MLFPKKYHDRLGICVDTAHIFSAGIPINEPNEVKKYFNEFKKFKTTNFETGVKRLIKWNINNSKIISSLN